MKVTVLALFSLIFSVNAEDAKPAQSVIESLYPLYQRNYYYGNQGNFGKEENKGYRQRNNYKNQARPFQNYGNNNYGYERDDEYNRKNNRPEPENNGYYARDPESRRFYGNKRNYQYRLIGRVGLGFDKRTATSYGYLAPITPELLELVGSRPFVYNSNGYNYQNLNLSHNNSNKGRYGADYYNKNK